MKRRFKKKKVFSLRLLPPHVQHMLIKRCQHFRGTPLGMCHHTYRDIVANEIRLLDDIGTWHPQQTHLLPSLADTTAAGEDGNNRALRQTLKLTNPSTK